jgi:hypothetical protein
LGWGEELVLEDGVAEAVEVVDGGEVAAFPGLCEFMGVGRWGKGEYLRLLEAEICRPPDIFGRDKAKRVVRLSSKGPGHVGGFPDLVGDKVGEGLVGDGLDGEAEDGKRDIGVDGLRRERELDRRAFTEVFEECCPWLACSSYSNAKGYVPVLLHGAVPKKPAQPSKLDLFACGYPYAEKLPNGAISVITVYRQPKPRGDATIALTI